MEIKEKKLPSKEELVQIESFKLLETYNLIKSFLDYLKGSFLEEPKDEENE